MLLITVVSVNHANIAILLERIVIFAVKSLLIMSGKVIIFSAPSGAGKSTVVGHLLGLHPEFEFSVSATSRPPRGTEQDGVEYYFITADRFRELIAQDAFVEYEEVYEDRFYGTLKSEVERIWANGHVIVFDVDVQRVSYYSISIPWSAASSLAINFKYLLKSSISLSIHAKITFVSLLSSLGFFTLLLVS